jgi:hypothetical protein
MKRYGNISTHALVMKWGACWLWRSSIEADLHHLTESGSNIIIVAVFL